MIRENIEWPEISRSVILFVIALLTSVIMIKTSSNFKDRFHQGFLINQSKFRSISQQYLTVNQKENIINLYHPRYIELLEQGVVGKEQRLSWIETLRSFDEQVNIPEMNLNYEISPQKEYIFEYPLQLGKFKIYSSHMKLGLNLLHEGDLIHLLETMNSRLLGLSNVRGCELRRKQNQIFLEGKKPNLEANCEIIWFTIKKADGTDLTI